MKYRNSALLACLFFVSGCSGGVIQTQDTCGGCDGDEVCCDFSCTALLTDRFHCGDCDTSCSIGEVCVEGECQKAGDACGGCAENLTCCGVTCVDAQSDSKHCGVCDNACPESWTCEDGHCVAQEEIACGENCKGANTCCGSSCVNMDVDIMNCGSCQNECKDDQICLHGQCIVPGETGTCEDGCAPGYTCCGESCVDLTSSSLHCGGCDLPCDAGLYCDKGQCTVSCQCSDGMVCNEAGTCVPSCGTMACGADEICCNDTCVKSNDAAHCGRCDQVCSGNTPLCVDGSCSSDCASNQTNCDGTCVDLLSDDAHCGACTKACGQSEKCEDGKCQCRPKSCAELGLSCGSADDGCGNSLGCGSCPGGLTCDAGTCGCRPKTCGELNLNCGTSNDGCGGLINCGTCGSGQTCNNGTCGCSPKTCAGMGKNCGDVDDGCGNKINCGSCSSNQTCSSNVCQCKAKTCAELGKNCGSVDDGCGGKLNCGTCPSGQSCKSNVCKTDSVKDTYPKRQSIKGLQPDFMNRDEVIGNGVHGVSMNLVWASWQPTASTSCSAGQVQYDGYCYTIDARTEETIREYSKAGVLVTAIVYGVPTWCRRSCSNVVADYFCAPTTEGSQHYGRFVGFLANYFNGDNGHGRIADFVIHNEVNATEWFNYGCKKGTCNLDTWTSIYAESWNAAYDYARKEQKQAKVLISLEHDWTTDLMGQTRPVSSGEKFLQSLIPKLGNREWRVAYHSYPPNLLNPAFGADDLGNSGAITFGNIGVLAGWLRKNYPNKPYAWEIQLTENGINGIDAAMQTKQASQLCQAFRNVLGTPGVESFIYHRLLDHSTEVAAGLALGLWSGQNGGHPSPAKPAWSTFALANQSGALSCGFEYLPYVRMVRGSKNSKHWITTRQLPSGFNEERAWKILREPAAGTVMVYECRVGGVKGDHAMISTDPNCEGQFSMGPMGYVYTSQVSGTKPVYRCYVPGNGSHFVSPASNCEGQTTEALIGYAYEL